METIPLYVFKLVPEGYQTQANVRFGSQADTAHSAQWAKRACHAATALPTRSHYSGMLSCFFQGFSTCLLRSICSARAMRLRVECGMITSSM